MTQAMLPNSAGAQDAFGFRLLLLFGVAWLPSSLLWSCDAASSFWSLGSKAAMAEQRAKPAARVRISKICLMVYLVMFLAGGCLLSVPGDYWPWYMYMSFVAGIPLILGPRWYRLYGALALTFASSLILSDIRAGTHQQEKMWHIKTAIQHSQKP
jgi:hypothetical protein